MKPSRIDSLRRVMEKLVLLALQKIGPRMTMWSLYCIFAKVWSDADQGSVSREAWSKVRGALSQAADVCEELEVTEGFGLRSHPQVISTGGDVTVSEGIIIRKGITTCERWVKTTDKFPWLPKD